MSKTIGQQILEAIETTKVPIEDVAEYAGLTVDQLVEIIGGLRSYSLDTLCRVASSMGNVIGFYSSVKSDGSLDTTLELRNVE